jgi:hypothetical protein
MLLEEQARASHASSEEVAAAVVQSQLQLQQLMGETQEEIPLAVRSFFDRIAAEQRDWSGWRKGWRKGACVCVCMCVCVHVCVSVHACVCMSV